MTPAGPFEGTSLPAPIEAPSGATESPRMRPFRGATVAGAIEQRAGR